MSHGLINKQREPFSVRDKAFWEVERAGKLLEPKFTQNLSHEPDGLIFQPSLDVSHHHHVRSTEIQRALLFVPFVAIRAG